MKFKAFVLVSTNGFCMGLGEITTLAIERSSSLSAQEMEERSLQSESYLKSPWQNPQALGQ